MSRFSQPFQDALGEYVKYVLGVLGFQDWTITLLEEPAEGTDTAASITFVYGQRRANVKLSWDFFDLPRDVQTHCLLHEMCHLFSEGIDTVIQNGPETIMGKPAYTIFYEAYRAQMEVMTDNIALAMEWGLSDAPKYIKLLDAVMAAELTESLRAVADSGTIPDHPGSSPGGPDQGELHGKGGIDCNHPGVTTTRGAEPGV